MAADPDSRASGGREPPDPDQDQGAHAPRSPAPPGLAAGGFPVLRWAVFLVLLGLWTWKLLEPAPVPEELKEGLAALQLDFAAAKSLHAGGYALLTVLAGTLRPGRWWRVGAVVFMALHGVGSEAGQYLMDVGRQGTVRDVLIDWAGVAAGAVVLRGLDRWAGPPRPGGRADGEAIPQ